MSNTILDCGCEIELIGKGGHMRTPCSVHFGKHKVGNLSQPVKGLTYRIGLDVGDEGAYKYFETLEGAQAYWDTHKLSNIPDMVFQRRVRRSVPGKKSFTWQDI